jgi:hypothetical protein
MVIWLRTFDSCSGEGQVQFLQSHPWLRKEARRSATKPAISPDLRTVKVLAAAAVRRAFLARAWLQLFLRAARYPQPEALIALLLGDAPAPPALVAGAALPTGTVALLFTDIVGSTQLCEEQAGPMWRALASSMRWWDCCPPRRPCSAAFSPVNGAIAVPFRFVSKPGHGEPAASAAGRHCGGREG